jgi:hypothetical protein
MRLPRPPRVVNANEPPQSAMPTPAPLDESDGHVNEVPLRPRRRRLLMGEAVASLGRGAAPRSSVVAAEKAVGERERREKSRRLLSGGVNEGERRGFGASAPSEPA